MTFEVEVSISDEATRALAAVVRAGKRLRPVLLDFGEHMVGSLQETLHRGGRPDKWRPSLRAQREGGQTLIQGGTLVGSFTYQAREDTLRVGTNVKYAALQHSGSAGLPGGVVRPTKSKYLTIPLPGVTRRAGSYANTFVVWRKKGGQVNAGHGIIFQRVGKDKVKPLFILRKQVKIPARPFMMLQEGDQAYLVQSAGDYLSDAWEEA